MSPELSLQKKFDGKLKRLTGRADSDKSPVVLLAVSGGRDSMCMAELFLHTSVNVKFAVAHCNFHLRGEESDSDEALVRSWAERAGVKFHKADFDTRTYASEHSVSIEMAARELRYNWFSQLCKENGYTCTAVAHNANDNAETLILNLLRGTGMRGLAGMQDVSEIPVTKQELTGSRLIRPLLTFSRSQIDSYMRFCGIEYHDDRTNAEIQYKRNAVRHEVLPVFERLNPSFLETISREMRIFSKESVIAEEYFIEAKQRVLLKTAGDELLRIDMLALQREKHVEYLLFKLLEPFGFAGKALDPVLHLVDSSRTLSGRTFFSRTCRILTTSGWLAVFPLSKGCVSGVAMCNDLEHSKSDDNVTVVNEAGSYLVCGLGVEVSVSRISGNPVVEAKRFASEEVTVADLSVLTFPFLLRGWCNGDWICPIGTGGRKKLSDMFIDLKLNLDEKQRAVVAVLPDLNNGIGEKQHVVAVFGHAAGKFFCRVDEAVRCTSGTDLLVKMSFLRNDK